MYQVFLLICFTVCGLVQAEHETDILKRLEATERLVRNLYDEVASQKEQISDINKQLHVQQQRNIQLGRLNRRLTASKLKTVSQDEGVQETVKLLHDLNNKNDVPINRIRRAGNDNPVAFFAKMDNNFEHASAHQNFVFEVVVANVGNSYNSPTGEFVAPVSGYYLFSTTLVSYYHVNAHAQFAKNGKAVTNMYLKGTDISMGTASQTMILPLLKGDVITVQSLEPDNSFLGGSHSTFSGFLLFGESALIGK